jgi:myo-inositol-1(or 4)-monophosphatase
LNAVADGQSLAASFAEVARSAGDLAMRYFRPGEKTTADIAHKANGSPVTEADLAVDRYLAQHLRPLVPEAGWLSEETADSPERLGHQLALIVDPIDGTRGFAAGDPRWAVCIALVEGGRPTVAVVHAPALQETYVAVKGGGAHLNGRAIQVSDIRAIAPAARLAAPEPLAKKLRRAGLEFSLQPRIPSLALRLVGVASAALDLGLASENSHDWDIAAADLILLEAGGLLTDLEHCVPVYNSANPRHDVLGAAPRQIHAELISAARRMQ